MDSVLQKGRQLARKVARVGIRVVPMPPPLARFISNGLLPETEAYFTRSVLDAVRNMLPRSRKCVKTRTGS